MGKSNFELVNPMEIIDLEFDKDTRLIFSDYFFKSPDNLTEVEKRIADRYLNFLNYDSEDTRQIKIFLQPKEVFNFLIHLQREIKAYSLKYEQ
jgi:hypothetical protein